MAREHIPVFGQSDTSSSTSVVNEDDIEIVWYGVESAVTFLLDRFGAREKMLERSLEVNHSIGT